MTNLEALQANISDVHGVVLTQNHFMKALIDQSVAPYDAYSSSSAINRATLTLYDVLIEGAGFSEGALSYNINIEGVKAAKAALQEKMGITEDPKNQIRSPKVW